MTLTIVMLQILAKLVSLLQNIIKISTKYVQIMYTKG